MLREQRPYRLLSAEEKSLFWSKHLTWLSWVNLAADVLIAILDCGISESWWVSAALTYLPRVPYAIPAIALLILSALFALRLLWVNAISLLLVLGPIMGFSSPVEEVSTPAAERTVLRVVSCNIQDGTGSLPRVLLELDSLEADIVALQETAHMIEPLEEHFAAWQRVQVGEFFVASRYPVRLVRECYSEGFKRRSAILCEVETPDGPVRLVNLHLQTARHGLAELQLSSLLTGDGIDNFEFWQRQREEEAAHVSKWAESSIAVVRTTPQIVVGDFNTPTTSSMFMAHWQSFTSAYETSATGYGYTVPCNTRRLWPGNTPWARIDHILVNDAVAVHSCRIGTQDGSDHRSITARLSLK